MNKDDLVNIKKIEKKCNIYYNHIRCENNEKIYTSSITHDDGTMYIKPTKIENIKDETWEKKYQRYKIISSILKSNDFANLEYIWQSKQLLDAPNNIKKVENINEIIFYYPYPEHLPFPHYIGYGYQYFYYYVYLKKMYPNIKIIMNNSSSNKFWMFLKDILNLENILYIDKETLIINNGITYCIYSQMDSPVNFTNECIQFYSNIAQTSLLKNHINLKSKLYPKKLLFLRKDTQIPEHSKRLLENREQISDFCKKYGYVDIDQTTYSVDEVIYLINNATHLISEHGSAIFHLLWANQNIKTIVLVWTYEPYHITPNFYSLSNKYLKLMPPCSGKMFERILIYNNCKVILNNNNTMFDILKGNYNNLPQGDLAIPKNRNFLNFDELEKEIVKLL
jgi:hypothetical protein